MTSSTLSGSRVWDVARASAGRRRVRLAVLALATLAAGIPVADRMSVDGSPEVVLDRALGEDDPAGLRGVRRSGAVDSNIYGLVIAPHATGTASLALESIEEAPDLVRTLRLWAGGPDLETSLAINSDVGLRRIGSPSPTWIDHEVVVPPEVSGESRLVVRVRNTGDEPRLFLDLVLLTEAPRTAEAELDPWLFALFLALLGATTLYALRRLDRHWPLVPVIAAAGWWFWSMIDDDDLRPLETADAHQLLGAAREAEWLDLEQGLLTGSFEAASPFAVQVGKLLSVFTGTGSAGTRAATVLAALLALALAYAVANRIAGRAAAWVAVGLLIASDAFRDSAISGGVGVYVLIAVLGLLFALHACLARTSRLEATLIGVAAGLAFLAVPVWLPTLAIVLGAVALRYAPAGERLRFLAVAAGVALVVILPNRISTAAQHDGNPVGDISDLATGARNVEFGDEGSHGAPSRAERANDPTAEGDRLSLTSYLFAERSLGDTVDGTLEGFGDGLDHAATRDDSRLAGLFAFLFGLLGALYLLIVPRLRVLVLVPVFLGLPAYLLAARGGLPAAEVGVPLQAAMVVGAGALTYAALRLRSEAAPEA